MQPTISEVQIVPIKPSGGLVGFASFILNNNLYLGSIGIMTRPEGGYRLTYPTKQVASNKLNIYYPINKQFAKHIETEIISRFEEVMKANNDRHHSIDF